MIIREKILENDTSHNVWNACPSTWPNSDTLGLARPTCLCCPVDMLSCCVIGVNPVTFFKPFLRPSQSRPPARPAPCLLPLEQEDVFSRVMRQRAGKSQTFSEDVPFVRRAPTLERDHDLLHCGGARTL